MEAGKRGGKGRRRIEIKRIESREARQVTFSKRRAGLFKKAAELCVLCGVQAAAVAFSPGGRPYVFGDPSVDGIMDRFLGVQMPPASNSLPSAAGEEFRRDEAMSSGEGRDEENAAVWEEQIERFGLEELARLSDAILDAKRSVKLARDAEITSWLETEFPLDSMLQQMNRMKDTSIGTSAAIDSLGLPLF
ncbi:unnamed protein product [Spirodela intermedia]|uniref:MADS-box domain-containing protein n=1 Tax=Spirodela intermedia TaxID=51605 RepID=A0A7I8L3I4_SPIIN|nr:unnamed protein product [Spirodela intermedia]